MTNYISERVAGREHIPLYPKGFAATRIIQLVLSIICLGLSAYATSVIPLVGTILVLFTSLVTLISSIYLLVAHFGPPTAYNYWAILGLDIFLVIFWLISFGLLAAQAAFLLAVSDLYYYGYTQDAVNTFGSICAAAAGFGAIEWVIYLVTLIMHSIALHRHRKAGLHAMPGAPAPAPYAAAAPVAPVEQKFEMQNQQPGAYDPYHPHPPVQGMQQPPQGY